MCSNVVYLRSHGRRPVAVVPRFTSDAQGAIPAGWCLECGREVFAIEEALCDRCRSAQMERRACDGSEKGEPLF